MQIKLQAIGVSEIVGGHGMSLLMLTDEKRERLLAVVCDHLTGREIVLRVARAPMLTRRLPEVLAAKCGITADDYEIIIYDVYDGEYKTVLHHKYLDTNEPIRVSDGILLALIAKLDVWMDDAFFHKQSVPYDPESHGMAIPINTLSTKMLQGALQKAIDDENYEMASQLRDELKRRSKTPEPPQDNDDDDSDDDIDDDIDDEEDDA